MEMKMKSYGIKKIISKEEIFLSDECDLDIVLRIVFGNSDILELEGVENENCLKVHVKGLDWMYLKKYRKKNILFILLKKIKVD